MASSSETTDRLMEIRRSRASACISEATPNNIAPATKSWKLVTFDTENFGIPKKRLKNIVCSFWLESTWLGCGRAEGGVTLIICSPHPLGCNVFLRQAGCADNRHVKNSATNRFLFMWRILVGARY